MPLGRVRDGVRVAVRLQPGASADRIEGIEEAADGSRRLRVRVTAAPEKGKANKALVKLLAKAWSVPASSVSVVVGAKDRNKTVQVDGGPESLYAALGGWLRQHLEATDGG